jgi:hypothetical protein
MGRRGAVNPLTSAVLAAPLALGGCAMTSTYGTGEVPEMALVREVTGGIMGSKDKEPIDYQSRPPLVMPPATAQLPAPAETASAVSPDWPSERDLQITASANDDDPYDDVTREDYRRLRPLAGLSQAVHEDMRSTNAQLSDSDNRVEYYRMLHHGRSERESFETALAESKGFSRSERRYLTDPPLDYREPAPTAPTDEVDTGKKKRRFWSYLFSEH